MRSISRITGVSINTVSKLLVDAGTACAAYHDKHVRHLKCRNVQADEIWSFCGSRRTNKTAPGGDIWTWTSLCADSKLICNWLVGSRELDCAILFMRDLSSRLDNRIQLTTDGHKAYRDAVELAWGYGIDYAQLVKPTKDDKACKIETRKISGSPMLELVSTSYVERMNLNIRMDVRRYARKTNAFSKKVENHCCAIALYFAYYNFVKIHKSLRVSPAMAAGIEARLWSMLDILRITDSYQSETPPKNGIY